MNNNAQTLENTILNSVGKTVIGAETVIHHLCIALIVRGHILLEGVPGVGKTLIARSLACCLGGNFKRIQCTADLMPADMTGIHIYNEETKKFTLMPGPLFADVVLVDEINRTGPKTQSAMLEAMEERTITIDRKAYSLSDEFLVIATQNPHEFEGTYPLPESQLDRFLMRLMISYPDKEHEIKVLKTYDKPEQRYSDKLADIQTIEDNLLEKARQSVDAIHVADSVYEYCQKIAIASREHPHVNLGLSTRGALALIRCARAEATLRGGGYITPDDIKTVSAQVMGHRLQLTPDAQLEGDSTEQIVNSVLSRVEVPRD